MCGGVTRWPPSHAGLYGTIGRECGTERTSKVWALLRNVYTRNDLERDRRGVEWVEVMDIILLRFNTGNVSADVDQVIQYGIIVTGS